MAARAFMLLDSHHHHPLQNFSVEAHLMWGSIDQLTWNTQSTPGPSNMARNDCLDPWGTERPGELARY